MLNPGLRNGDSWQIIHDWISETTQDGEAVCSFCGAQGFAHEDSLVSIPKVLGEAFLEGVPANWDQTIYAVPAWCVQCHYLLFFKADQDLLARLFIDSPQ